VAEADLLLHVVDAAAADPEAQIDAVRTVLVEIGADRVPELLAFNKIDLLGDASGVEPSRGKNLLERHPGSVLVSAHTSEGVVDLLEAVGDQLRALSREVELVVPYRRGDVVAALHRHGEVLSEQHEADASRVRVRLDAADVARFAEFRTG